MVDSRFFMTAGPFTLAELAGICGGSVGEGADASKTFIDVAPLQLAGPDEVSFLDNSKYRVLLGDSGAGACIVHPELLAAAPKGMALILSKEPYRAYARVAAAFHPPLPLEPGIAANADVHPEAEIGEDCEIRSGAVIGRGARIGPRTLVGALTVVGENVEIGADCRIDCHVTLSHCVLGDRVCIATGVRIGQAGFGFAPSPQGHLSIPQLGRVIVGDDVDIGANTTVDRGAGPDTVIGQGCRIDNLVQIGHNVVLGRGCVLVGQSGVSGSARLGDFVMLGGQAGVAGHLSVGAGARIGGKAGVMRDVPMGATVIGMPAIPIKTFFRQQAILARLASQRRGDGNG